MKKILAFSGSYSQDSINHKLAEYAGGLMNNVDMSIINLSDYESPFYSKEVESENGIPSSIKALRLLFNNADGFILSTPEYNGSIPAGLKNTLDWVSRMEGKIFQDKPVLLMATSPGARGGLSVLNHLSAVMPFWGAKLVGPFSLPKFGENFIDGEMNSEFKNELNKMLEGLNSSVYA